MIDVTGYEIKRNIFSSNRSHVYKAVRLHDDRQVIIKVSANPSPTDYETKRFRREFEMGKNFDAPNIIRYLALEPLPRGLALIEEDFGAVGLREIIPQKGFDLNTFFSLAIQLAEGLSVIHRHGIIHKDIKPSNIVVAGEQLKIIDFGISAQLSREPRHIMGPSGMEGTLAYMSPEQTGRMNRDVDYRTDFYSLGATFYEMLTGKQVFNAKDSLELIHCHIAKVPMPPHEVRKGVPSIVSHMIMKLLAKNAESRYQSAQGLKADLVHCLEELEKRGVVNPFPLASEDFSDKFQIPQKLYGRDNELEALLSVFERVDQGSAEMLLVSGAPGVGKSRLVNEIRKPITGRRGYVISGKFDHFSQDLAYSAIAEAFQELMKQVLGENEEAVEAWRTEISEALAPNAKVICDIIPELEHLIGKPEPVQELGPRENRHRFNLAFRKFVSVFAKPNHPLVLFLDDLQWADLASLKLIRQLVCNKDAGNLFLIGAYRNDEVNENHMMMLAVDEIREKGASIAHIHLESLGEDDLTQLIAETLHCEPKQVAPLATVIDHKTHGNPFFVSELLLDLYREHHLRFDHDSHQWIWNLEQIKAVNISDNVITFMVRQLERLPEETLTALRIGACIGNRFDLRTLSLIGQQSHRKMASVLLKAVKEGILVPLDDNYRIAHLHGTEEHSQQDVWYKFPHDRVLEAAYALVPEDHRKQMHLNIGRLMYERFSEAERDEKVFEIVHQLNEGIELIKDEHERECLTRLNLLAAKKANIASAARPALIHLEFCLQLLPEDPWNNFYELSYQVYREYSVTAYLVGEFKQAEAQSRHLLERAQSDLEKVEVLSLRSDLYVLMGDQEKAIEANIEGLQLLGIELPTKPSYYVVMKELFLARWKLRRYSINELENRPEVTSEKIRASMRLFDSILTPAFALGNRYLFALAILKQLNLTLEHGNCAESSHAFAGYGMLLGGGLSRLEEAAEFGSLAWRMNQHYGDMRLKCKIAFARAYSGCWTRHGHNYVNELKEAVEAGLQNGDLMYTAYSCIGISYWNPNLTVDEAIDEGERYRQLVARTRYQDVEEICHLNQQFLFNLAGKTFGRLSLSDENFDEANCLERVTHTGFQPGIAIYHFFKLALSLFYEEYDAARTEVEAVDEVSHMINAQLYKVEFSLYAFLAWSFPYANLSRSERQRGRKRMRKEFNRMKRWMNQSEANYRHHYLIMEAELARLDGRAHKASQFYAWAAEAAHFNGYPRYEALANELAARFHRSAGMLKVAEVYMRAAYDYYLRWGAKAKLLQLEDRYGQDLLKHKVQNHFSFSLMGNSMPDVSITHTLDPNSPTDISITAHQYHSASAGTETNPLDLATVLKATRTISGEINLRELSNRMMLIMIENAGAQRGFLIMEGQQGLDVLVSADTNNTQVTDLTQRSLNDDIRLSHAVVRYVFRTGEHVVLDDASKEGSFTKTKYIKVYRPKSILCMPIRHMDTIRGILYLENNLITSAFTEKRVQVLYILLAQAAISLDNAKLFEEAKQSEIKVRRLNEELEQRVADRTKQLEETRKELMERAHHAGMADIATTVLHNVGNILNSVITSTQLIRSTAENSKVQGMTNANKMLTENREDLGNFLSQDPKGQKLFDYYLRLEEMLKKENQKTLANVNRLIEKVYAIKDVIVSQQSYASGGFQSENIPLHELIEDALSIQGSSLTRHEIEIEKDYSSVPIISVQKVKLIHIVINLIKNAKEAMADMPPDNKKITIRLYKNGEHVLIEVSDTGSGIKPENLDKIFNYGFTTKDDGHGFGLHGCANAMTEMGGQIWAESDGQGKGARFIMSFPIKKKVAAFEPDDDPSFSELEKLALRSPNAPD